MTGDLFNLGLTWRAGGQAFARVAVLAADRPGIPPGTVLIVPDDGTGSGAGAAGDQSLLPVVLPFVRRTLSERMPLQATIKAQDTTLSVYVEPVLPGPSLVILGAGHIALALAPIAITAGYDVTVVDDRPEYAVPGRFPGARVVSVPWATVGAFLPAAGFLAVALLNRSYDHDVACLRALWSNSRGRMADYIGMIGSRRRVAAVRAEAERAGVPADWLEQVHAPIGLDIGAETPGEIAVAVMAEVVLARHRGEGAGRPSRQRGMGADWPRLDRPAGSRLAVATVVSTRGATPRKAGASMLVWEDGHIAGTAGGGGGEEEIRQAALEVLRQGVAKITNVEFTADPGETGARICGGVMTVLVEPVVFQGGHVDA